jgi:hypothetical protein
MRDTNAPVSSDVVSPDSSEGRERLSRIEERVDANRRQIEVFGPLPLAVALVQRAQEEFRDDLKEFRADVDRRFEKTEKSMVDQNRALLDQVSKCGTKISEVGKALEEYREAERKRREEDAKTIRVERTQDVVSKRTLYGVLGAAGLASLAALLTPIMSALFG